MKITAKMVAELRARTGAGMMDCKKALTETDGDLGAAITLLREKGLKASELKSSRETSEGLVLSYIHPGNKIGALVEVNCETDFVARNDLFQELVKNVAMQIAASKPKHISRDNIPASKIEEERRILRQQALDSGKPEKIVEKIVDGRISKFYSEICLLEQPYIRDTDKTVQQLIQDAISKLGENIVIRRFSLFILGQ